jgi:hypothetical protein
MDGRKIPSQYFLAKIEKALYSLVLNPDIAIELTPDLDTVLKRNKNRVKLGKETDVEIVERYGDFLNSNYSSKSRLKLNTSNMSIESCVHSIINYVCVEIAK